MFRPLKTYQIVVDVVGRRASSSSIALPVEIMVGETGRSSILGAPAMLFAARDDRADLQRGARRPPVVAADRARRWRGRARSCRWRSGGRRRPADVAIFGVLYVTAAYGSRPVYWPGFASALVGALVITLYLVRRADFASGGLVAAARCPSPSPCSSRRRFALLLAWTVGALVRAALRASANREAQERAEAEAVVEQERVRIARDMHDVVAHSLAVVIAQADGARYAAACRIPPSPTDGARHDLGDRARRRSPTCGCCSPSCATARATARSRRSPTSRRCTRRCARGRRPAGHGRPGARGGAAARACSSPSTGSCRRR